MTVPSAIAIVNRARQFVDVNPAFEALFGFTRAELLSSGPKNLIIAEGDLKDVGAMYKRVWEGEVFAVESRRRHKDGHLINVRVSATRVGVGGEAMIFTLYTDITTVRRDEEALRASKARLAQVLASSTAVIYATRVDGDRFTPTWVSENLTRITGHRVDEALDPAWWRDRVHPDDLSCVLTDIQRLYIDGQIATEYRFRPREGPYRWIRDELRLVRDDAGRPREVFGTWLDITDRKLAEDTMREGRDLAERSARARATFLANMSHEIRTPMNAVLGLTELVLDTELSDYQRRSLGMVRSAAETLLTLLNDVLDFSKIEAEHLSLEHVPFDLRHLLESTVSLLAVRSSDRPVELAADVGSDMPHIVRGDPTRLRQVLTNLVGNAIKFTNEGEVILSATTVPGSDEPLVRFTVRDTGIGIPADQVGAIFEEFMQADASMTRKYGGTGLGLAIAKRLVTLMGGELTVTSEEGHGSEFAFTLSLPVEEANPAVALDVSRLAGQRILVVDDNATNRRLVREMLGVAGITVEEALGADAGLAAIRLAAVAGHPYGLAIIDAQMPGRDGFYLATAVRAEPDFAHTRMHMLTSATQQDDTQRCREIGIEGYLTKPASRTDLLEMAAALLDRRRASSGATVVTRHSIAELRPHMRILLAEDNLVNQEVAATMLRKRGHEVDVVENGHQAVEAVARRAYDAVLMDIQMPVLDGFEATHAIRAGAVNASVPIIALTAHAQTGERERCIANGMTGYLPKPFRPHELFAAVESITRPDIVPDISASLAVSASRAAAIDVDGFRRSMRDAGAEDAVSGVLDVFAQQAPTYLARLRGAVDSADVEAIGRAAHAFKSPSGSIGALRLAGLLHEIELAGSEGSSNDVHTALAGIERETEVVLQELRTEHRGRIVI